MNGSALTIKKGEINALRGYFDPSLSASKRKNDRTTRRFSTRGRSCPISCPSIRVRT